MSINTYISQKYLQVEMEILFSLATRYHGLNALAQTGLNETGLSAYPDRN
ncbi:hypothetical protein [uncultured Roseivirga sp.]|nr:hypothetical protein [uncultured Roseivirga sp.]